METGERWVTGRKAIAAQLDISTDKLDIWRERYADFPAICIDGTIRVELGALRAWMKRRAENTCPVDRDPCHRASCCGV